jgi:leader peptidase (prepilin peptidase)/N-methyltransferase
LAFGSFINALVWRLREKISIAKGRSMCVHCRHTLAWYDLIPVASWLMLRGRCRYCSKPISWQYPLVELATAGLFVLSFVSWQRELSGGYELAYFGLWLAAIVLMAALTIYDLRWLELPDKLTWPFVLTGLISTAILSTQDDSFVLSRLQGMALAWGFFALLYYGSRGKWLGGGDVKFALGMGAWLGSKLVLVGVLTAFYSASLIILPLLLLKLVKRKQPVPFGPFLIAGTITAMLWGQELINWYQDAFLPPGI